MISVIDDFLNSITTYRLVLYCLVFLWCVGFVFSFFGMVPFDPVDLIASSVVIYATCIVINIIFEIIFKAPSNPESTYITALILSLVAGPERSLNGFLFLALLSFVAIASKYLLAINKKHLFNPAAFSMVALAYAVNYHPSWWIGDAIMYPFVLITGLLIVRKLQRFDLVLSFFAVFVITSIGRTTSLVNIVPSIQNLFFYSPILFFSFVMLPEPSTTPPTRKLRVIYGSLVALLIDPFFHIGNIYFSPELALGASNIFSFFVSFKSRLVLTLKEKKEVAKNTFDFVFSPDKKLAFEAGQYMEFTLKHKKYDARGVRRYFTLASSPTESTIHLGVKFYEKPSSFKKNLWALQPGETIVAAQLAGEFIMPENKNKKLVFLAGGIGVTPFRSMVKYLLDMNEKRDITIFYAANSYSDIAYKEIFDQASRIGVKTIYVLNDTVGIQTDLIYEKGFLTKNILEKYMGDYQERMFYISGPKKMIDAFKKTLKELGIPVRHIKTDFFPGYA